MARLGVWSQGVGSQARGLGRSTGVSSGEGLGAGESGLGRDWHWACGESELHTGEDVGAAEVPGEAPSGADTWGGRRLTRGWSGLGIPPRARPSDM